MAAIVFLVSAQILIGMDHAWLPGALLRRSMPGKRLRQATQAIRPYARFVDRLLWPRLTFFTRGLSTRGVARSTCNERPVSMLLL